MLLRLRLELAMLGVLIDFAGAMTLEVQLQVILREKEEGKMHTLVGSVTVNSVMPPSRLIETLKLKCILRYLMPLFIQILLLQHFFCAFQLYYYIGSNSAIAAYLCI